MSFSSQSGQVGIKTQASPDTYADPGSDGIFFPVLSSGLGGERELLVADPEIGGSRDITGAVLGTIKFSGEYEFYVRPGVSFATILKLALGSVTVDGTDDPEFLFEYASTDSLPWFSIEEAIGDGFECFNYTDAKINSLHLEAEANGYMKGSFGVVARKQAAGKTPTVSPTWDASPFFVGHNITLEWGGVTLPAKSFSFDLTNNLEDDDFRLGSLYLGDVPEKRRDIKFGFNVRPQDKDLWRQAMYGSSSATEAGGEPAVDDLVLTCTTYSNIAGGSNPYTLTITAPNTILVPFGLQPSGDDVIEHDVEAQVIRPPGATDVLEVTLLTAAGAAA